MRTVTAWGWFAVIQLISLAATLFGLILLIPFCLAQAWNPAESTLWKGRVIDCWSWTPLNWVYGNPEDGVSGQTALIWLNGTTQGRYQPDANPAWRAYRWSALRNSCDNLKYVFAWKGGPFYRRETASWFIQLGWNSSGFPVISAGKK